MHNRSFLQRRIALPPGVSGGVRSTVCDRGPTRVCTVPFRAIARDCTDGPTRGMYLNEKGVKKRTQRTSRSLDYAPCATGLIRPVKIRREWYIPFQMNHSFSHHDVTRISEDCGRGGQRTDAGESICRDRRTHILDGLLDLIGGCSAVYARKWIPRHVRRWQRVGGSEQRHLCRRPVAGPAGDDRPLRHGTPGCTRPVRPALLGAVKLRPSPPFAARGHR